MAVTVWRSPCGGRMTCHVTWQDNPLRVTTGYRITPVFWRSINVLITRLPVPGGPGTLFRGISLL